MTAPQSGKAHTVSFAAPSSRDGIASWSTGVACGLASKKTATLILEASQPLCPTGYSIVQLRTATNRRLDMRLITQLAATAFRSGTPFHRDNTSVSKASNGQMELWLHGHLIAKQSATEGLLISLCGWPTPTTRERINGLLRTLGYKVGLYQEKHVQYIGVDEMPETGYYAVKL